MAPETGHKALFSGHIAYPLPSLISGLCVTVCKAVMQANTPPPPKRFAFQNHVGAVTPRPNQIQEPYLLKY